MNPTTITNAALIDLYRAYPARHPDRGILITEMRKRGMLEPITPVAKEDPYHVDSGPEGGQFTSGGGGGATSSTALPSNSPPPTSSPTVNYSSQGQGKKAGSGKGKAATTPHSQIPPTPKAPGQVPVSGLKKPTVHITKPKTVAPIHAKKGSTHTGTHIAGKGPKISSHNPKIKLK